MTVDLDAIVMFAHSEKQQAARDLEEDVRIHPMTAWADHEARWPSRSAPRNPGLNTAADHIVAARLVRVQLPRHLRRKVLIRAASIDLHEFLAWRTVPSRWLLRWTATAPTPSDYLPPLLHHRQPSSYRF